ncbi:GFA family protein [Methylopila henanensis]|uniref:GFA family protein n=1 Tax=Methylopila henanensis TaxID=873516 RepID=A0ABW4K8E0_9HYPH
MGASGGCLCEGVRYRISGALSQPIACHCSQCARTSGSHAMMSACRTADLTLLSDETLAWHRSSENVRRGFCRRCGGNLFWQAEPGDEIYVTAGTLDAPTGLRLGEHIYVGSKSDYYDIADGLPQKQEW